jgi:2-polyprenyl-6-methoxyphenol hydroxylase-like FAD-dependent oxidoreductase
MPQPILIAGGGIGGLTTGIALRRAGFEVRVFERASRIGEVGAGLTVQSNAILALRRIGLDQDVIGTGRSSERQASGGRTAASSPGPTWRRWRSPWELPPWPSIAPLSSEFS